MVEDEFIDTDAMVNSNPASAADYDNLRRLIAEGLDAQKKLYFSVDHHAPRSSI